MKIIVDHTKINEKESLTARKIKRISKDLTPINVHGIIHKNNKFYYVCESLSPSMISKNLKPIDSEYTSVSGITLEEIKSSESYFCSIDLSEVLPAVTILN